MGDYKARHIIEALRSGVPSRAVGEYFSEARPNMMKRLSDSLEKVREEGLSSGMLFTGKYGEGKTHLLNTVFNMASSANMVVSVISLGKETPISKTWLLYQKVMANTYLPNAAQPGFMQKFEELTPGSAVTGELLAYAAKDLETDKLYYLLRCLLGTQEDDERFAFLADLEGDFAPLQLIKTCYKRVNGSAVKFSQNFSKTKHSMDYFYFMSHFFKACGYDGWVIMFDEIELLGRLGKKTRISSYVKMQEFLKPCSKMENVFCLFALSSSYADDVIDKKHEYDNVNECLADNPESLKAARSVLDTMMSAPELAPLTKAEITNVLMSIQDFHGRAYDWTPDVSPETLYNAASIGGYLLRTQIRAAIEFFDQLYQYGEAGGIKVTELGKESFEEEDVPELF